MALPARFQSRDEFIMVSEAYRWPVLPMTLHFHFSFFVSESLAPPGSFVCRRVIPFSPPVDRPTPLGAYPLFSCPTRSTFRPDDVEPVFFFLPFSSQSSRSFFSFLQSSPTFPTQDIPPSPFTSLPSGSSFHWNLPTPSKKLPSPPSPHRPQPRILLCLYVPSTLPAVSDFSDVPSDSQRSFTSHLG